MRDAKIENYKKGLYLTGNQKEVLIGILLGDGCLETQNGGKTYRLKVEQSVSHRDYLFHLYHIFRRLVRTPPRVKRNNYYFQTLSLEILAPYGKMFYGKSGKKVPGEIHTLLTPRAFAYWFMDDGSRKSQQSKGVLLNTQCFKESEVEMLCELLTVKFGLFGWKRLQKEGFQIYISGRSAERFVNLVKPYIHQSMLYKLPL